MREGVRTISLAESLNEALREEMRRDATVFLYGEGIQGDGRNGITKGILGEFGPERIIDTPLDEELFVGIAIGAAQAGLKPVVEFMYANFLMLAMSDIVRAGAWRAKNAGKISLPIVIRATVRNKKTMGQELSGDPVSMFVNIPGIKVVFPSSPFHAKGLLKSAIRDLNPVLFFEDDILYEQKGLVPERDYVLPIGKADIIKEGNDLSVISYGRMLAVLEDFFRERGGGVKPEIVDLVTLKPFDEDTILSSAQKTKKVLVVEEGWLGASLSSGISAFIHEHDPTIRIKRLGAKNIPLPFGALATQVVPNEESIEEAVQFLSGGAL